MKIVVEARKLAKSYGSIRALKGIDFSIREGECFGFLGHNGAGKSTMMRMLYGLSTVEEGSLTIFGERIAGTTPPRLKGRLGVVPQEDSLDPELSVFDNLLLYGGYFGLSRQEADKRSRELLAFMDLAGREKDDVETLSGGLKRRLVIARALINNPRLVLLDEPTTGLDPQARRLVWQKLRQLKEGGTTLILTTHYMDEATQMCDRLVIMHEGVILTEGSPQQLVERHLPAFVIEVRLPLDKIPAGLNKKLAAVSAKAEVVADHLFLFTADGRQLWKRLEEFGLPQHACYLRPSGLEDVFLLLTGGGGEE